MFFRSAYKYSAFFKPFSKTKQTPPPFNLHKVWMKRLAAPAFGLAYYAFMPGSLNQKEEKNWEQQLREEIKPVHV